MTIDLNDRILEYLSLDTNYAIILTGDYGIGKTHYLRNELFPVIAENNSALVIDSDEAYTPILISLFGVDSIEEIHNKVFLELYPILNHKGMRIAAGIGKNLLKHFSGSTFEEIMKNADTSSSDFVGYRKVLLCIDDIDRKSKRLDLDEVYGYVNNLVENLDAKVLLIANEDELKKEFEKNSSSYELIREKVIGVSLSYQVNVRDVFFKIVNSKYKLEASKSQYYNFLIANEPLIVQRIIQNKSNLRNLLFFTEHFKVIYNGLSEKLKEQKGLSSVKDEIYQSVLNFSLPIAIEYKLGRLNRENSDEIKDLYRGATFNLSDLLSVQQKTDEEPSYHQTFKRDYIAGSSSRKIYFDSIFSYLVGESAFNIEDLINEVNKSYSATEEGVPDRELALNALSYWECVDLSSSEYRRLTNILLESVDDGLFNLEQYPTVFHYVTRFDNMLNYNLTKLLLRFKRGIRRGLKTYKYSRRLRMRIALDENTEFSAQIKNVIEYCETANNEIKVDIETKKSTELLKLYEEDFSMFLERIEGADSGIGSSPFFAEIDFKRFWRFFRKLNNSEVIDLGFYFTSRYQVRISEELFPEKEFVDSLVSMLKLRIGGQNEIKLTKASYSFVLKKLEEIVPNFPEIE